MNKVVIYGAVTGQLEHAKAGEFNLSDGVAVLSVLDDRFADELNEMATEGVGPFSLKRMVKPNEGELFLTSLIENFAHTSYWSAVDESDK